MSADALRAVRARVTDGWSQNAGARDAAGEEVSLASEDATSWALCSAFALAGKDGISMSDIGPALRAIAEVTQMSSIEDWNDEPGRTQQQVLDAIDAALERVEGVDRRG